MPCPTTRAKRVRLMFAKMAFKNQNCVVTSLRSSDPDLVAVQDLDGAEATQGNLQIVPNLNFTASGDEDTAGYLVFKGLNDAGTQFQVGPVVEGVVAGSEFVQITSSANKTLAGNTVHQGVMTIDILDTSISRDGPAQLVALGGGDTNTYNDIMHLVMPAGRDTEMVFSAVVPVIGIPASPKVRFSFEFMLPSGGTRPAVTSEYLVVPRATTIGTKYDLPDATGWTAGTTFAAASGFTAYQYSRVESGLITLPTNAAGAMVQFKLIRSGTTDGYSGNVGILRHWWHLVPSS